MNLVLQTTHGFHVPFFFVKALCRQ